MYVHIYVQESTVIQRYLRLALLVADKISHPPQVTPATAQPLKTPLLSLNLNTHMLPRRNLSSLD